MIIKSALDSPDVGFGVAYEKVSQEETALH